jgi:hypothetical protein
MGMNATIRRLSDDDLSSLLDDPELVPGYLDARHAPEGFGPFRDLNLEESWHAIHFLLTGSAWAGKAPLNFVATGGKELGEDSGHGPARCLSANQVRKLAAALDRCPTEVLLSRFDPAALTAADVYPGIWSRPPDEQDPRGYVGAHYDRLRKFVMETAVAGQALIVSIG